MKRYSFIIIIIMSMLTISYAQQSPKDIHNDLQKLSKMQMQQDDYLDSAYTFIREKLTALEGVRGEQAIVNRAIWNNCMANLFYNYLTEESYQIDDRTHVAGERPADIKTWDRQTFLEVILEHFNKSLTDKEILQKQALADYRDLLNKSTVPDYEPTLYDFLVRNLLEFLRADYLALPMPTTPFRSDMPELLADNATFTKLSLTSPDPLSFIFLSLQQYQELTRFHLQSGHPKALINISIERLTYVYNHCGIDDKEKILFHTLHQMADTNAGKAGYEELCFELAQQYHKRAASYDRETQPEGFDDNRTALDWCRQAMQAAPGSTAADNAKLLEASITKPWVMFYADQQLLPNQPNLITYQYRNCEKLYCRAIPCKTPIYPNKQNYPKLIAKPFIKEWTVETRTHGDYRNVTQPDIIPDLPLGSYIILVSPKPLTAANTEGICDKWVQVTDLAYTHRNNDSERYTEFLFYRRSTGEPIANHNVWVSYVKDQKSTPITKTYKTDSRGMIRVPAREHFSIECKLTVGKDLLTTSDYYWWWRDKGKETISQAHLFTDRRIYRPGQTVHFKCILIQSSYKENNTIADQEVEIVLKDANRTTIGSQKLSTNLYGSVSGEFLLPTSALTGNYTLQCKDYAFHTIRVEEYKRPQFEATIEQPQATYRLGDRIDMSGTAKAYAGYPIDGATVKYRVTRWASYPYWKRWWIPVPASRSQEIVQGETITDAKGRYTFSFTAAANPADNPDLYPVYRYAITATITDLNGETHEVNSFVFVGKKNLLLQLDMPDQICADKTLPPFKLTATNLDGVAQNVELSYRVERLLTPSVFKHQRCHMARPDSDLFDLQKVEQQIPYMELDNETNPKTWKVLDEMCHIKMTTQGESQLDIPNLSRYQDGYYKLTISTQDKEGQPVSEEHIFMVFHHKSKSCAAYEPVWIYCDKTTAQVGETVTFYIGSYLDHANIFLEMSNNDTLLKSEWLKLQRGVTKYTLPIKEEHRGEIIVKALTSHQGIESTQSATIQIPFSNKIIETTFETFRDLTTPGAKEEWRITLKGKNGEKIAAELLCSMYDASIDVFRPNSYQLPIDYLNIKHAFPLFNVNQTYYSPSGYTAFYHIGDYKQPRYATYKTDWNMRHNMILLKEAEALPVRFAAKTATLDSEYSLNVVNDNIKEAEVFDMGMLEEETAAAGRTAPEAEIQVRSNFAETAFFYPHLYTNQEGDIVISCTLPESLTQWKMLGVAHTTDLMTGTFEKMLRTRKELMIVPNVPRFLREGDTLRFAAKVVCLNDTAQQLSGRVTLTLTDATTGQPLDIIDHHTQPFVIYGQQSAMVSFNIAVPQPLSAITYRITATCNEAPFTDGQEATLPVLANRMLVTETCPFFINGKQEKKIVFKSLEEACALTDQPDNTLSHHKLTLEFTANPIWYAIGALPYMMEYPYECNEQIFSRLYGNALATHVANSSPAIEQVFNDWKKSSADAFCSNLEKNAELKNIVLEESPWVMEATNESARRQQMGQLFDSQRMAKEMKDALYKLEKNQKSSGAWPWFAGGYDSPFITRHIVAGLGHLKVLGVQIGIKSSTLNKAVRYLDNEAKKDYDEMKKANSNGGLYSSILHYLYARSFFLKEHSVSPACMEAYKYYIGLIRNHYKKLSFYDQAMAALVLYRNNDPVLANKIVDNLKSYAQYSEEMGMWWKKQGFGFSWNEALIERQALLIEAFQTIAHDTASVEQMQTWLLKQKQTQNWSTTKATTEACYALLLNSDLATMLGEANQPELQPVITIGHEQVAPSETVTSEVATGHIKTSWAGEQISQEMAHVTLSKPTKGTAWGSLYWQYFENLDKIKQDQTIPQPLSLSKQLYKVVLDERSETLQEISEQTPLRVGDKVRVRIELRADRDMEYIHLKDMRGAGFELQNNLSGYRYQNGLSYYEAPRDAAVNFFFDYLPKGTHVFEYTLIAEQVGTFSNGISTVQCMYAPEFAGHSAGEIVHIKE